MPRPVSQSKKTLHADVLALRKVALRIEGSRRAQEDKTRLGRHVRALLEAFERELIA